MSKVFTNNKKEKEPEETKSTPIVNVEWNPPTDWVDQFSKLIADLSGVPHVNRKNNN